MGRGARLPGRMGSAAQAGRRRRHRTVPRRRAPGPHRARSALRGIRGGVAAAQAAGGDPHLVPQLARRQAARAADASLTRPAMPVPAPPPPSAPPPPPFARACATSAACLEAAALRVAAGLDELSMVITTDRTSNGPVLTYPSPSSPGGAPRQEHWVLDSFRRDPWGGLSMHATAEPVAAEVGMTRESLDQIALLRYQQYQAALAHNRAFQRAYMVPVTV